MSQKLVNVENRSPGTDFWNKLEQLRRMLVFLDESESSKKRPEGNQTSKNPSSIDVKPENTKDDSIEKKSDCCPMNNAELLKRIEEILADCVDQASRNEVPTISMPNRKLWKNTTFEKDHGLKMNLNPVTVSVGNSKDVNSARVRRFGQTLHLFSKVHYLLRSNTFCTKRELYYQDVKFYGSQTVVDNILDDIACLLQVQKIQMHVLTTSKGCIAGALHFKDGGGNYIDCSNTLQGLLVPNDISAITNIYSEAQFILIVEKDATFQTLLESDLLSKLHPCILITGKGFPDVNTRQLLKRLWDTLKIPILALVDADPYGIEILCIYTYGSLSLSFDVKNLAVPQIRWLGILPSDIQKLQFPESALVNLTEYDLRKASHLLTRSYMQSRENWSQQVRLMLSMKKKAEIEGLCKISESFLTDVYLPNKIKYGGWI